MAATLRRFALLFGVVCVLIGAFHFVLGVHSVPGERHSGATVDSRERFYGAVFLGYGLAWVWASRRAPVPAAAVRWLSAVFLLGGAGRAISFVVAGRPQWFQTVLAAIEIVLPVVFLWLAPADERAQTTSP